jgi:GNAT superfamily N-acetyltransferase
LERYRQEHASKYFLAAYEDEELIGFICSTLTSSPTLTHESMETHEPSGEYLAIHSVCVSPDHRRKGIAKGLLREYIRRVREANEVRGIRLIAKEGLVGMYERSGFTSKGKSQVVHGQDPWFELGIDFQGKQESTETLSSPFEQSEDVDPASVRSPGKRLASATVTKAIVEEKLVEDGKNKFDLYCPRAECRCFLIRKGAASWVAKGSHKGDLEVRHVFSPVSRSYL